jgi:hypothetical protein
MATSGYKSVSRVDHAKKNAYGWLVRVAFRGKLHSKFFSDLAHKGRRKALKAAIAWRNKTEKELGKPRSDRHVPTMTPSRETGVVGIRLTNKSMTRDGRKVGPVYEVSWAPSPGVMRRTSFSITKFGEREAFGRAYAFRKEKERLVYGRELPAPAPPTRKSRRPVGKKKAASKRKRRAG